MRPERLELQMFVFEADVIVVVLRGAWASPKNVARLGHATAAGFEELPGDVPDRPIARSTSRLDSISHLRLGSQQAVM